MDLVQRPQPKKQKINTKDDFELCYLRHQYIRRSPYNPTPQEIEPYTPIINNQARKTLMTNSWLFSAVGLGLDDIINIGKVHVGSFLNLYSMEKMPGKMAEFVTAHVNKKGREPDYMDLADKNKANFTQFLKQRNEDLVRVCRQKARNIEGVPSESFVAFAGKNPPRYLNKLLTDYSQLGFRKLDPAVFRTIKKRARPDNDQFFKYQDEWYIVVHSGRAKLTLECLVGSDLNPYNGKHAIAAEELYLDREDEERFRECKEKYENMSDEQKAQVIRDFINKKNGDIRYHSELRVARRLLKGLE